MGLCWFLFWWKIKVTQSWDNNQQDAPETMIFLCVRIPCSWMESHLLQWFPSRRSELTRRAEQIFYFSIFPNFTVILRLLLKMIPIKQEKRNHSLVVTHQGSPSVASVNAFYILKAGTVSLMHDHTIWILHWNGRPPTDNTNYYYHYYNYIERWRKNDGAFNGHSRNKFQKYWVPDDNILIDCETLATDASTHAASLTTQTL